MKCFLKIFRQKKAQRQLGFFPLVYKKPMCWLCVGKL